MGENAGTSIMSRLKQSSKIVIVVLALAAQANATVNLTATTPGRGAPRYVLLSDDAGSIFLSNTQMAQTGPGREFALLYLKHYPESLGQPNDTNRAFGPRGANPTEAFAQYIMRDDWVNLRNVRNDPPKLAAERERLWNMLKGMTDDGDDSIRVFYPVQINVQAYDADKEAFPILANWPINLDRISLGVRNFPFSCIELDRKFELKEFPVAAGDAAQFIENNRDRIKPAAGAKVYVALTVTITGKTEAKPGRPPQCQLEARLESVDGFEFKGLENRRYDLNSASPGGKLINFYTRDTAVAEQTTAEQPDGAAVTTPFKNQEVAADASADAKEFELHTFRGQVLLSPGNALNASVMLPELDMLENLKTYADFVALRTTPEMFKSPYAAQCLATHYLDEAERSEYFSGQARSIQWKGANEFENRRLQQAFYDDVIPRLSQRASATPLRFLVVAQVGLPEYDFDREGFQFNRLTTQSTTQGFYGRCPNQQEYSSHVSKLQEFWAVSPGDAEQILLSIPTDPKYPGRNLRFAYLASEVELVMFEPRAIERYENASKMPVLFRTLSATLYKDLALTEELFKPVLRSPGRSVLETGVAGRRPGSDTYEADLNYMGDLLVVLKEKGDLTEEQWAMLSQQQISRDYRHYMAFQLAWNTHVGYNRDPYSFDTDYIPFFPANFYTASPAARPYDSLIAPHRDLFKQWSKMLVGL